MGLAGIAGVAATGVVIARAERERRAYTPDDVRSRLHERAATIEAAASQAAASQATAGEATAGEAGLSARPTPRERWRLFVSRLKSRRGTTSQ